MALPSSDVSEWNEITQKVATLLDPRSFLESFYRKRTRPDGRLLAQSRDTRLQQGVLRRNNSLVGSAKARIGETLVLSSVSILVGQPASQRSHGDVVVVVEDSSTPTASLNQGAATTTTSSANNTSASRLQSFLQRVLMENLDLQDLSIVPGRAAFRLSVLVHVLHADGSVTDACLLAATAALLDTQLPVRTIWEGNRVWLSSDADTQPIGSEHAQDPPNYRRLHMPVVPVSLTMGGWEDSSDEDNDHGTLPTDGTSQQQKKLDWIVDPSSLEERVLSPKLTMVIDARYFEKDNDNKDKDKNYILAMDFAGSRIVQTHDLALASSIAAGRARELQSILF